LIRAGAGCVGPRHGERGRGRPVRVWRVCTARLAVVAGGACQPGKAKSAGDLPDALARASGAYLRLPRNLSQVAAPNASVPPSRLVVSRTRIRLAVSATSMQEPPSLPL